MTITETSGLSSLVPQAEEEDIKGKSRPDVSRMARALARKLLTELISESGNVPAPDHIEIRDTPGAGPRVILNDRLKRAGFVARCSLSHSRSRIAALVSLETPNKGEARAADSLD
jgi:hypothetical protein